MATSADDRAVGIAQNEPASTPRPWRGGDTVATRPTIVVVTMDATDELHAVAAAAQHNQTRTDIAIPSPGSFAGWYPNWYPARLKPATCE